MTGGERAANDAAIGALELRVRDLGRLLRGAEAQLFRRSVAERVGRMSPLLADLARRADIDLPPMLDRLRPLNRCSAGGRASHVVDLRQTAAERRIFAPRRGYAAAAWSQTRAGDRIGLGLREEWIDVSVALAADARLDTRGDRGFLRIGQQLPETVRVAMTGTPIDRHVVHELLFGSGYVVIGCRSLVGGTRIELDIGGVDVDLPRDFGYRPPPLVRFDDPSFLLSAGLRHVDEIGRRHVRWSE